MTHEALPTPAPLPLHGRLDRHSSEVEMKT
jgi:hypothetical protein